jgi:adenosylcobinamide kinase/adenosylcobinamide-phosphate guanylyltransferase
MARITLIVGGSRSGKSDYARTRAESLVGPRLFLATAPPLDDEMRDRIAAHRQARSTLNWETLEEYSDIVPRLRNAEKYNVILVDCLTLWLNNLIHEAALRGKSTTEQNAPALCEELLHACAGLSGSVFLVANEVGMGIIPDNPLARTFRDLAGRCNQLIAAAADEVILVSCGIPVFLKGGSNGIS